MELTNSELRYLLFVVTNDIETLDNGDFDNFDDRLESETAKRLAQKLKNQLNESAQTSY